MERHLTLKIIAVVLLLAGIIVVACSNRLFYSCAEAQGEFGTDASQLTFCVSERKFYFFDHGENRVYVYSDSGDLRDVFKLEQLGADLISVNKYELRKMLKDQAR